MNTYAMYCPNVYVAKCTEEHAKGDIIEVATCYGSVRKYVVHNLVKTRDAYFYYSITHVDAKPVSDMEEISLSVPASLEWYKRAYDKAVGDMEAGKYQTAHPVVLAQARRNIKDLAKKVEIATKLWGDK